MQFSLNKPARLGKTQLILIDGPAGAGKTTLANVLKEELCCDVIHLEYLYNGWDDALTQTLTDNLIALCNSIKLGKSHWLPIYDWEINAFNSEREILPSEKLIIEGVGAGQAAIRHYSSSLIWVDADPDVALDRVMKRDGFRYPEEISRWKIREAAHFKLEQTAKFADFHYSTS